MATINLLKLHDQIVEILRMKVVALVSGGKDSCFNMVVCQRYDHEIVALANLLPPQPSIDELDSYMYQTVGHQVVESYAQCMGLPLFRRRIHGVSHDQQLVYKDTVGDEVEDLYALLCFIKERIPDIQAVSSGAIASDYQRTRVERVCARLGFISLAYLWHQPQGPLLQQMIDSDIHAIFVKVAAAGLHPLKDLGKSLEQRQQKLQLLRDRYGCNVCGEGGEYETLTLDCPLFKYGRIVLDAYEVVTESGDELVGLLHPTRFHVEPKEVAKDDVLAEVVEVPDDDVCGLLSTSVSENSVADSTIKVTSCWSIANGGDEEQGTITALVHGITTAFRTADATTGALEAALYHISQELAFQGYTWDQALFVHLYVPAMQHFAAANAVYSKFLPAINPPARATVELAENKHIAMVVEVLASKSVIDRRQSEEKKVLHVQSISEWAPSCIGPYSQAVAYHNLVYFAGQIPLDPPTMTVAFQNNVRLQTIRSLQSCQAVAVAMKTDLRTSALWWTIYYSGSAGEDGRVAVQEELEAFLAGEGANPEINSDNNEQQQQQQHIDEYLLPPDLPKPSWVPLITFVELPALPRSVDVEVQPVAWSTYGTPPVDGSGSSSSSSDDGVVDARYDGAPDWIPELQHRVLKDSANISGYELKGNVLYAQSTFLRMNLFVYCSEQEGLDIIDRLVTLCVEELQENGLEMQDVMVAKVYVSTAGCFSSFIEHKDKEWHPLNPTVVPVLKVRSDSRANAALALEILARHL